MAFLLYECRQTVDGFTQYTCLRQISLAGNGPLADFIKTRANPTIPEWQLAETKLLGKLNVSPEKHAVVIDLKPKGEKAVSLYRIKEIRGYSPNEYTLLLVRLEALFVEKETPDPPIFKQRFDDREAVHSVVYEFLYLLWDKERKIWNWGRAGSVNGALLFPDALPYFLGVLNGRSHLDQAQMWAGA